MNGLGAIDKITFDRCQNHNNSMNTSFTILLDFHIAETKGSNKSNDSARELK